MYSNLLLIGFLVKEEMIQNADDAVPKWFNSLWITGTMIIPIWSTHSLGNFQEPSLITANKMLCSRRKIGKECRIYKGALRQMILSKLVGLE